MPGLDLEGIGRSVVKLRAEVPEDAFTAGILGSQRTGNGVVINSDGLILTIGYLITEATDVWLTTPDGRELVGHPLAYDQVTGFGLVMPLEKADLAPIPLGSSAALKAGDHAFVVSSRNSPRHSRCGCSRAASSPALGNISWMTPSLPFPRILIGPAPPW